MKKLILSCLVVSTLYAQEDLWDANLLELENTPPPLFPFSITAEYLNVSKTGFRTPDVKGKSLRYIQSNAAFAYTQPFNEVCGLIFGAGWVGTVVDMQDNPEFNETDFNYVNLSIGAFTKSLPDWSWVLTISTFFDTQEFSLAYYTLYQGVLWGKYELCKTFELDFGIITEFGLAKEKVWPIFGFVYLPSPKWNLSVVYPINIALEYKFLECLTAAGSIRFLRNRHRVQKDEPNPQGIFEYHTTGAEFDLLYSPWKQLTIKGFAGSTFDGDLKITNRNDNDGQHFKFKGSFYAGISGLLSF